jgi:hypothetical protein
MTAQRPAGRNVRPAMIAAIPTQKQAMEMAEWSMATQKGRFMATTMPMACSATIIGFERASWTAVDGSPGRTILASGKNAHTNTVQKPAHRARRSQRARTF